MPPTTGIGPGIERMAMIFTEQENIDDVIFFPLMRPAISPVNAGLYGIQQTELAPVEDLTMAFDEFESLCAEGVLKPHTPHLTIKPHVRVWSAGSVPSRPRASGHVEIEGFLPNSVLRLGGFRIDSKDTLSEAEKQKVSGTLELSLVAFLHKTFPDCKTTRWLAQLAVPGYCLEYKVKRAPSVRIRFGWPRFSVLANPRLRDCRPQRCPAF